MKKSFLAYIYIYCLLIGAIASLYKEETAQSTSGETKVIPDEAIRLRILANSDAEEDQELKRKIRDEVKGEITSWVQDLTSVEEARNVIRSRVPELEEVAEQVMDQEGMSQKISVEFNKVAFPTKLYGNFVYPAGDYEAVLITLGEGQGANWWCVLFPPLCFLDFSNGEAVQEPEEEESNESIEEKEELSSLTEENSEDEEEPKVKFFLVEWFEGLFS
ncbi:MULTISPECIES: stage II sporulation protein R [Bacillus]|uniref:Stage II sporulation protein R n=2 Tax=Bacillus TaxID=1386 RepID=A0A0M4FL95_9BACI|nr:MULTISPECIES: stage II sporulation protein R [Bacillus]ALC82741.1 stage II sporulation protein R [Bacillus gobiensis]MBP1081694.1 stage II sporulation protein R [Bacillus capparidis]MED1096347.1 stage II sporulation protein R [Bacillus capparidis]